ncbi:hypothetical protein C8J27_1128 [Rhodobacter aestuarii]|uniref:Uncharacterized protein n=1 Tax=Rhodobacter aestuarii TaxID=453582 RepID=A0A1N7Q8A7_9RHOB|nr:MULTISPECIES: hypothetical protein [Rhodobacter]PTV93728.1 hypothetical protein C8J27_1128 [Rhodobacter aestuarii]SIT19061.1 hypothetical protein SAMN05421580_1148 [Rhodobacter aestuarii]SOC08585.1 hypothetical protein SAMN05877809_104329 [Rhodobacter sp. JA431]
MTMTLRNRFTAALTAIALATGGLTATGTPAAAMSDNDKAALGIVLGIGAMALIADSKKDSRAHSEPAYPRHDVRSERRDDRRWDDRRRDTWRTIPGNCVVNFGGRETRSNLVSARCAADAVGWRALPTSCKVRLHNDRSRGATFYQRRCLEDHGFRIDRR